MLLDGQERALRAYHASDRETELVVDYFVRVGLADMVDAWFPFAPWGDKARRFYPVFTNPSGSPRTFTDPYSPGLILAGHW
jgi:hypothetical protein